MTTKSAQTKLSRYLNTLVKGGLVPFKIAAALNQLPTEKQQAQALAQVREGLLPLTEQTVTTMLNPPAAPAETTPTPPAVQKKSHPAEPFIGVVFMVLMFAVLFNGVRDVGGALWSGTKDAAMAGLVLTWEGASRGYDWWLKHSPIAVPPDPPLSYIPAPIITEAYYVPPHKVFLRWKRVGQGCTYNIYRTYGKNRDVPLNEMALYNYDRPWRATSAIVDAAADGPKDTLLGVAAVSQDGRFAGPISNQIRLDFNRDNRKDTLEPAPPR